MESARIIGIPGSGKTTRALDIIDKVRGRGFGLGHIGFITFTRAARREAAARASERFQVPLDDLEKHGWFRTIHSCVMRILGASRGELVCDRKFIAEAVGEEVEVVDPDDDSWADQFKGMSPATLPLSLWDISRQRLLPFRQVWEAAEEASTTRFHRVSEGHACQIVAAYEAAKKRDGRCDFTDYLLRFAGFRCDIDGPEEVDPEGEIPNVPIWAHDEHQDVSLLLNECFKRLVRNALWVYLFGDPFQAIYSFSGADATHFTQWPAAKEEILGRSWRCSKAILDFAVRLIAADAEFTKKFSGKLPETDKEGGSLTESNSEGWHEEVRPTTPTLVMARTNREAAFLGDQLTKNGIPWRSNKTGARFPKIVDSETVSAFDALERGDVIDGYSWGRIVSAVPKELLVRGTKARFTKKEEKEAADFVNLNSAIVMYGCTPQLADVISSGNWKSLVPKESMSALQCRKKWGEELCDNPAVIVSTIHGTKGLEAQKVFLHTGITGPVCRALETEEGQIEERRVWYVGATRAKEDLTLVRGRGQNYEEIYEAMS